MSGQSVIVRNLVPSTNTAPPSMYTGASTDGGGGCLSPVRKRGGLFSQDLGSLIKLGLR